jgi:AcrR family transcriptional regulator
MAPRRYRTDRRQAAMQATRQRIVEATVALHAEQGGLATTYAQIAARADVAVPTVYKHFPEQDGLFAACTGHVMALSPPLGPSIFEGKATAEARLGALVGAVFACHRFQAPWMRLGVHEAALIPALGEILRRDRARLAGLIRLALAPRWGEAPPPALVALIESLLDFTAWQRLVEAHEPGGRPAEETTSDALLALLHAAGAAPAIPKARKPKR